MRFVDLLLASVLTFYGVAAASAQICTPPPAVSTTDINLDTSASIHAFRNLIGLADGNIDYKTTVQSLFAGHPDAIQWYATLSFYYDGCVVIRDSHDLSDVQRLTLLLQLRQSLMPIMQLAPVLTTSPSASGIPPGSPPQAAASQHGLNMVPQVAPPLMLEATDTIADPAPVKLTWAERYLRPVPTVVTSGNQYWVDVGWAPDENSGKREIAELKQRFPSYDFALYEPFGRSDKWNIVIASWVSGPEARDIVSSAKAINDSSFVWRACSAMNGTECVLNRKYFLSTTLKAH